MGWGTVPYAYPLAYGYDATPADEGYDDSYSPAPAEAPANGWSAPQYPGPQYAGPPEPPPHSTILNMENMEAQSEDTAANPSPEPAHYYIALKDHHVYLAVAYWVDGDTLHYFLPGNTHNQVSLSLVDRDLMERLNRESGVEVHLPPGKKD